VVRHFAFGRIATNVVEPGNIGQSRQANGPPNVRSKDTSKRFLRTGFSKGTDQIEHAVYPDTPNAYRFLRAGTI
jgi:hypothetical protein